MGQPLLLFKFNGQMNMCFKKMTQNVFVCLLCFVFANHVNGQTRQQNNPLDKISPADTQTSYDLPAINDEEANLSKNVKLSVQVIDVVRLVPNASKTAVARLEPVNDPILTDMATSLLEKTNNQPSYDQLNSLTATMSKELRDRGQILSTVYIPAQKITAGRLALHLLEGTLGDIEIIGKPSLSSDVIEKRFAKHTGKVATREGLESSFLRVQNLLPGVSALGSFKPGNGLGESVAIIDINKINTFSGSVYLDNYGNEATGEHRLGTRFFVNNPFGLEDRLRVDIIANQTPDGFDDPQNPIDKNDVQCCFGGFSYEIFSDNLLFSAGLEWSHTQYDIGNNASAQLASLGFNGESNKTRLFLNYYKTLTRKFSNTWSLGVSVSRADLLARNEIFGGDVLLNRDRVSEYDLNYSFTLRHKRHTYYGQIAALYENSDLVFFPIPSKWIGNTNETTVNEIGQTVRPSRLGSDQDNSFRVTGDLNALFGGLAKKLTVKTRLAFQFSEDVLAPVQQFSLAGPYGVRAYPSGSFIADNGLLGSIDLQYALLNGLGLSVFYDIGHGDSNDINGASEFDATIQGIGLGARYQYSNMLSVNLTIAHGLGVSDGVNGAPAPNIRNGGEEVSGRDTNQIFASIIYNF